MDLARLVTTTATIALLALIAAVPAAAAPGDHSAGFGTDGVETLELHPTANDAPAMTTRRVDSSNQSVTASTYVHDGRPFLVVERRFSTGTLDTDFGDGGRIRVGLPLHIPNFELTGIAASASGQVTLAGSSTPFGSPAPVIVQPTTSGRPDTQFGIAGIATPALPAGFSVRTVGRPVVGPSDSHAYVPLGVTAGTIHYAAVLRLDGFGQLTFTATTRDAAGNTGRGVLSKRLR